MADKLSRYAAILREIFTSKYRGGATRVSFEREELRHAANTLGIEPPSNLGDIVYSHRYRVDQWPDDIAKTARGGKNWVILGVGRAKYEFRLMRLPRIEPNDNLLAIKIPDSTPEIVTKYAQSDEQALLAKVRYNRLLDIFLGVATYSLQNHLRTTVEGMGQVELDEVYVGVDKNGRQYVVPVQAKGGTDKHSAVQTLQDMACCREKFGNLLCRPISTQFAPDDVIAIFEMTEDGDSVKIVEERHYKLVPANEITEADLASYGSRRRP